MSLPSLYFLFVIGRVLWGYSSIFFVNTPQNKKHFERSAFCFGTMCSARAERDAPFGRDVCFASDVRFAREEANFISHCDQNRRRREQYFTISARKLFHIRCQPNISLYKPPLLCYNETNNTKGGGEGDEKNILQNTCSDWYVDYNDWCGLVNWRVYYIK